MATTIKVDGDLAEFTWQDDQLLEPLADVDLVRLNDDLTKGYPTSATPTTLGAAGTDTVSAKKSDPFSMTKSQLRQFAKENGFDSAVAKEVWQLPLEALRHAIADALRLNKNS